MYAQSTNGITVTARPIYLEEQSSPGEHRYVWAYQIRIENGSDDTVQLLTRHWQITDANGRVQEVRGDGVVGEQPILEPGQMFEYTSGCPLHPVRLHGRKLRHDGGRWRDLRRGHTRLFAGQPARHLERELIRRHPHRPGARPSEPLYLP